MPFRLAVTSAISLFLFALPGFSQSGKLPSSPRALVTSRIDEARLVTLAGNTRSEAKTGADLGKVADDLVLDHVLLQVKRPAERELSLQGYIDELHDSASPNFHKWLTADQINEAFGPAKSDIDAITGWLQSQGLTVNAVYPSGLTIDFSGTAGQVQSAFRTEIHKLDVNGATHIANVSDPRVPAALAPAVTGIVSLHDFRPRPMRRPKAQYSYTSGNVPNQLVVPGDMSTIYNLSPLYAAGITGQGQTIAVIEDSNLYRASDWTNFRSKFGLTQYASGTLTTVHPAASNGRSCTDPGYNSDGIEAALDVEWASAAAPNASIVLASCASSATTDGLVMAIQNVVNGSTPPQVMSISYGSCEAGNGSSYNATLNSLYQQAVAEGISVFVSSGDSGAAACDFGAAANHGIGVSAFASTPYNVAVGGTDFLDVYQGTASTYWKTANNTYFDSAMTYIPEIPWNDSCAGSLGATYFGYSSGYGPNGFCGSDIAKQYQLFTTGAAGGGPSGCATGAASVNLVVGGTCQGYAKPSWQGGVPGIPADGVRGIPDVSMFASDGAIWGHYYVFCFSDSANGGASCSGAPSSWAGAGGTSFGAPILAGIQALVNQKMGAAQGNPNPVYYKLAAGSLGSSVFNSVTQGDITVNCSGSLNCFGIGFEGRARGTTFQGNGALSSSSSTYTPAFAAAAGWNFATGLGSVNASNLVNNWKSGQ